MNNHILKGSKDIDIYEVQEFLLFEALLKYEEVMRNIGQKPKVRIVVLENISFIDSTGLRCLKEFALRCQKKKIKLVLSGVKPMILKAIKDFGICEFVNEGCIFENIKIAIKKSEELKLLPNQ